jgi:hypothetical protein
MYVNTFPDLINYALYRASIYNQINVVKFLIKNGATEFNKAMTYAIKGHYKEFVDFLIQNGADNWDLGLFYAYKVTNMDLFKVFIKKGATNAIFCLRNNISKKHTPFIKKFIKTKMLNNYINESILWFLYAGFTDLTQDFLDLQTGFEITPYITELWNERLFYASCGGFENSVNICINNGAIDLNRGMCGAISNNHWNLVDYFIRKGCNDWNYYYKLALGFKQNDMVSFFIKKIKMEC